MTRICTIFDTQIKIQTRIWDEFYKMRGKESKTLFGNQVFGYSISFGFGEKQKQNFIQCSNRKTQGWTINSTYTYTLSHTQ